jgi:hypothetical protein
MVLRYTKEGHPYGEPLYSKEEIREIERTLYATPKTITQTYARVQGPEHPPRPPREGGTKTDHSEIDPRSHSGQ